MTRSSLLRFPSPEVRSFSVDPKTKELVIRIHVGDHLPADLVDALAWISEVIGTARRTQEFCERQLKTDETIEHQRRRHIEVARAYVRLRACGMKHRESLRALFIDPTFSDLHASTADLNYWVKAYGSGCSSSPVVRLRADVRRKRNRPRSGS